MRESIVEKQFVEAVRAAGGQALKFTSQTMNGVPDRLVLLLGGNPAGIPPGALCKTWYAGGLFFVLFSKCSQVHDLINPAFCGNMKVQ